MASNILIVGTAVLVNGKLLARLCAVWNLSIELRLLEAFVRRILGRHKSGRGQESGNAEEFHLCWIWGLEYRMLVDYQSSQSTGK